MDKLIISPMIDRLIDLALEEDIGPGDVTTQALVPPELQGEAHIRAKADPGGGGPAGGGPGFP